MKRYTTTSLFILFAFTCGLLTTFVGCKSPTESIEEEEIERSYTKTIERTYSNDFERALIDSAEAAYPPRDSVIAAAPSGMKEHIPASDFWFYNSFDGILIPFAITQDAIHYYSTLIDSMNNGITHQFITDAYFKYRVNISYEEEFEFEKFEKPDEWPELVWLVFLEFGKNQLSTHLYKNVYVVKMYMEWDHYCPEGCGMSITQLRIVLLDENGSVQEVFLDGNWFGVTVL